MAAKLNRRSFFALGAAAAATGAAGKSLVPVGEAGALSLDGPLAAPDSPLLKKVKFTPLEIEVGAKEPFTVVHCSDTHLNFMSVGDMLGAQDVQHLGLYDWRLTRTFSLPQFAACVLKARLAGVPMIHTGDVWDFDSGLNMAMAEEAFAIAKDVFYAIGNHEIKGWKLAADFTMDKARARIQPHLPNDVLCASRVMHGVNFVSFDDTGYSRDRHDEMAASVKAEFARGMPVVVAVHEPFHTKELFDDLVSGKLDKKPMNPKNRNGYMYGTEKKEKDLVDWILAQPNLKAVICGHLHVEARYRLSDTVTQYVAGAACKGRAYEIRFT